MSEMTYAQALMELGRITAMLKQGNAEKAKRKETSDHATELHSLALSATPEAEAFADACNAMGRRMRAAGDCRPELRIRSEERKVTVLDANSVTAEEDGAAYAASMRQFHRR
jgi:hypothetical protein